MSRRQKRARRMSDSESDGDSDGHFVHDDVPEMQVGL